MKYKDFIAKAIKNNIKGRKSILILSKKIQRIAGEA